jgi:hypothetical protein
MTRGCRREQCCGQRGLARARFTRHRHSAAELHQGDEEGSGLTRKRVARHEVVERDVAHDVSAERGREAVADRRDRRGKPRGAVEDARLHHRVLGVELTVGGREETLDHLSALLLARRHSESPQVTRRVEVRHASSLEEDLFDVATRDEVGHRAEVGDRPQHAIDHDRRRHEREPLTQPGEALVLVDRAVHLDPHLVEIAFRPKLSSLDPREDVAADPLVRVDRHAARLT